MDNCIDETIEHPFINKSNAVETIFFMLAAIKLTNPGKRVCFYVPKYKTVLWKDFRTLSAILKKPSIINKDTLSLSFWDENLFALNVSEKCLSNLLHF